MLNSIGDTSDNFQVFKQIQLINLNRLSNDEKYDLSLAEEAYLQGIAESTSPMRAYARSILALNDIHYPIERQNYLRSSGMKNKSDSDEDELIHIYPNPVIENELTIVMNENLDVSEYVIHAQLYSLDGRSLLRKKLDNHQTILELELPKGSYILSIDSQEKNTRSKKVLTRETVVITE